MKLSYAIPTMCAALLGTLALAIDLSQAPDSVTETGPSPTQNNVLPATDQDSNVDQPTEGHTGASAVIPRITARGGPPQRGSFFNYAGAEWPHREAGPVPVL